MKPHKWAKEIKAWADGAEIQCRAVKNTLGITTDWFDAETPQWHDNDTEYRIKSQPKEIPEIVKHWLSLGADMETIERIAAKVLSEGFSTQPKEPQYLYFYKCALQHCVRIGDVMPNEALGKYIGKIKLEVDDE